MGTGVVIVRTVLPEVAPAIIPEGVFRKVSVIQYLVKDTFFHNLRHFAFHDGIALHQLIGDRLPAAVLVVVVVPNVQDFQILDFRVRHQCIGDGCFVIGRVIIHRYAARLRTDIVRRNVR